MANEKVTAIIDALKELSILDLADLKTAIQDEFGVDASAVAVAAPVEGGAAAAADEKTDFDVILASAGAQKIAVIKAVREATGLGLKEAKALVDGAPAPVKEGVPAAEAEELKATLEAAGATIELK